MKAILECLKNEAGFAKTLAAIDAGRCPAVLSGLGGIHRAHAAAALRRETGMRIFAVCADENEARRFVDDVCSLTGDPGAVLTAREFLFHSAEGASRDGEQKRLGVMYGLMRDELPVAAATPDALMQRTMPVKAMEAASFTLEAGAEYDIDEIARKLTNAGYSRCVQVEGRGQYAIRGGILDIFSPSEDTPVRCEFFGEEIDSMGRFDISSQRRTENIEAFTVLPASETLVSLGQGGRAGLISALQSASRKTARKKSDAPVLKTLLEDIERLESGGGLAAADRYMELLYSFSTAADYVAPDTLVVLCEPTRLKDRAKNWSWQLSEDIAVLEERGTLDASWATYFCPWEQVCSKLEDNAVVIMDNFTSGSYPMTVRSLETVSAKQLPSYGGSLDTAAGDIAHYKKLKYRTVVLCQDRRRCEILKEFLESKGVSAVFDFNMNSLPEYGECVISVGAMSGGVEYPGIRLAVISEGQLTKGQFRKKAKKRLPSNRQRLESYTDLAPGDLVVHQSYGIGRFVGIFKLNVDKVDKDYIKIAYAGTDSLFIPATQLDMITKYIGAGEDKPVKLSKLGGTDWAKTKSRAKGAAKELAKGLIELQAQRKREKGYAFSPDTPWQEEFEGSFEYQETDDQLRSIREIKDDMESETPMDRLLCGDVGYGKTEVALRAVMKCIMDGKQAAILVPTTVLAQQHYTTALKRFADYPVRIEVLSRFRTAAQLKGANLKIADGSADIVIGTHKLLQKDVKFKNLGLLVVDEEQRFGVVHKERLKELTRQVDVLTLSATPIPRTLNMALSGIRDMSTLEEPPQDRQPVQTYVIEHDWSIVCDAIKKELSRGGQVYYLHNRVENIDNVAGRLSGMLEDAVVAVAHGKMAEDELGQVMEEMAAGEIQVLVCTTIIETGIDIPNVNTLIIEDADKLGLAQLHQIRGRIGRSSRLGYAYLTFRKGKVLTEVAEKRLAAIREFAEFNSGFKIAMRDLEIRGAGNLLGPEQSGHMMSVGYDMYLQLLEEAVYEEKGEKPPVRAECSADFTVAANIPESYVSSAEQRMDLYRRIAKIRTEEDADDVTDELIDRFGDPPRSVNTLIHIALLRGEASSAGISEINQKGALLIFKLVDFNLQQISAIYSRQEYKNLIKIGAGETPTVSMKLMAGKNPVDAALKFIRAYREAGEAIKEEKNGS